MHSRNLLEPCNKPIYKMERMETSEILKQIRIQLRRSMNGVASKSMREKGLLYKLNFGVDIPRLRQMAARYQPDAHLADLLWESSTREMKILATLLHPVEEFDVRKAEKWVLEIPSNEIREQFCINLLRKLPQAHRFAANWAESVEPSLRTTGYWLLARLAIDKSQLPDPAQKIKIVETATTDLLSESYFLRFAAQNALKHLGRNSAELAQDILHRLDRFKTSPDPEKQEIYHSLSFEFNPG